MAATREKFGSNVGFILSSIGFAVGVGNLWRFPYLVGQYGGGVFLAFYLLMVFVIGIPLFTLEIALGSASQKNPVGAYKTLKPGTPWCVNGYFNVFAMQLLLGYTMPVAGWIVAYIFKTGTGVFKGMPPEKVGEYFGTFMSNSPEVIGWMSIIVIAVVFIISQGLNKGLEKANKIFMPALFIMLFILILRGMTLPGASRGLVYYLKPDMSKFTLEAVYAGIGQAFFSIGVGMAAGVVFGSYLKKEDKNLVKQGIIIGLSDTGAAFLAGLMIFPAVFAFNLEPAGGPGLTFVTMPNVFNQMPMGTLFGVIFYFLFLLAALSSWLGGAEAVAAFYMEELGLTRKKAVLLVGVIMFGIGIAAAYSMKFFGIADQILTNLLILGGLIISIFVGWVWGVDKFAEEAHITNEGTIKLWSIMLKYVIPTIIILLALNTHGII